MRVKRVAILGGGISGLTVAHRLEPYARAGDLEVHLIEARGRLGGVIQTDTGHGAILEGGPDSLLRRKPAAEKLCRDLGLEDDLIGLNPAVRGSYIFHRGRLHPIPAGVQAGVPTQLTALWRSPLLSSGGKLRVLVDLFLRPSRSTDDRGLGEMLTRHFGREVVDRLAEPMLAGIYAGEARHLSTRASFPHLLEMEARHGSLIAAYRRRSAGPPSEARGSPFLTLSGGMETLIRALSDELTATAVHRDIAAVSARPAKGQGWEVTFDRGQVWTADAVVAALPAHASATLVASAAPGLADLLRAIPYADLAVVGLLYDPAAVTRRLDRTGFLVPRGENLAMTACTWVASKWGTVAPGGVPLRVFFGRAGGEDVTGWDDDRFRDTVRRELRATMGIATDPRHVVIFRWPKAMPQYLVGHVDRVAALRQGLQVLPGLYLAGSYLEGVGVPDCIRLGEAVAESVARGLGLTRTP